MAAPSFKSIISDIRKGKFEPVYILMGEEAYYLDKIVEALEYSVIPEEEKDFNASIFYGAEADVDVVEASCRQYPMMADRRLVILKEAQAMQKVSPKLDKLAGYVGKPTPTTVFVLVYKGNNIADSSAFMKAAKKGKALIFKSPLIKDYYLDGPIRDYCQEKRISIDDKAVSLLKDYVGANLSKLFGEIDKLIVASGGKTNRINAELIEKNIGISKDFNNWELVAALGTRNYKKAIQIVEYFRKNQSDNDSILVTSALFKFFSNLVLAHYNKDKTDSGIMSVAGLKNLYALRDFKTAMHNYSPRQAVMAISAIRNYDCKSKGVGSLQNRYDLLRELIFQLVTMN